ncbi:NRDE domain containing protein [Lysobacter dokdonensis DS-58]|uniref:NRDE domain containing protein n=1 Tax=Lysobacter dokdonensis DS-58 TaxID=1300345 RepID=A0A0A2WEH0_9GAMM|nr:NRDE family protein [Lysobacter dokdonensis]KGQ18128.1 NRDE domain containing protein [Lysobacter dokdonensis DS-58]
MCLIAVGFRAHPRWTLAVIANRDEFHGRPAAPAGPDPEFPQVFGGRDLEAGGSWLLASAQRRFTAVTNVRAGLNPESAPRSRGALVRGFATGAIAANEYTASLSDTAGDYGRFNLLCWDGDALHFATNHPRFETHAVGDGIHAMSNGAFDAPWPKSGRATRALEQWLAHAPPEVDAASLSPLFDALADTAPAPDARLPDTGVGLDMERVLSPPFVRGARYGTRCSTVVLIDDGGITFAERRFGPDAQPQGATFAQLPFAATPCVNGATLR